IRREKGGRQLRDVVEAPDILADGKPADRIARQVVGADCLHRGPSQDGGGTALDDAEEGAAAVTLGVLGHRPGGPAERETERPLSVRLRGGIRQALVEWVEAVPAAGGLDLDAAPRAELTRAGGGGRAGFHAP